jgi:hypothetical protein
MTPSPSTSHDTKLVRNNTFGAYRTIPLAALAGTAFALAQGFLPEQAQPLHRTSDYLLEALFALSLFAGAAATAALPRLGLVPWNGRLSKVAVPAYAVGQSLVGLAATWTLAQGRDALGPVFLAGLLAMLVGGGLVAVAAVRSGVLPGPVAIGFGAALPLSMAIGTWGPLAGALLWLAVASAVRRR